MWLQERAGSSHDDSHRGKALQMYRLWKGIDLLKIMSQYIR